jgi:nicotinamide mononucleotide adenylyltransferase
MDEIRAFTMGRNQPYGHQHHAANDWMAQQIDADVLDIFIDDTHAERLPKSPLKGEELISAVERAYEEEYDTGYEVNVLPRDGLSPSFYAEALKKPLNGFTFLTREQSHAEGMEKALPAFKWFGYDVQHWPRDDSPFEKSDRHIIESSTEIRQNILEGGDKWRSAVSSPVEDVIDENYEEIVSALEPEGEYSGSKYKDAIASNGRPWSTVVHLHGKYF